MADEPAHADADGFIGCPGGRGGSREPGGRRLIEFGVFSFAETELDEHGEPVHASRRLRHLLEEAETAERVGLDVFGVGEHHRPDFVVSAPAVVLAAVAARTERLRLTSAVTVLGSEDPVRVFQAFSTLDLLSGGRAEIMAGRGSFTESFPLFGLALDDYDSLFSENLGLLLRLRDDVTVSWRGRHRPPLPGLSVYPRPVQEPLPVWIAVGGTPASVVRAGTLGLPLAVAIIGGAPARFAPLVDLYRESAARAGHDPAALAVGINIHAFIAEDSREAADLFWPSYAEVMGRIGRERGWPPMTRAQYEALRGPEGALAVGSPEEVVQKILYHHELFGHTRCMFQMTVGPMPHEKVLRSIELFGTEVVPAVRSALGS